MSVTPSANRRTPSGDVRSALVDAAVRVLERDGVSGLTVRAVAAEAGVAPMGVYNHLDGKDGLILAVLARGFDGLTAAITIRPGPPAIERLRAAGRGYRTFALANPVTYGLMFGGGESDKAHEQLKPHADPAFMALVDLVAATQREGELIAGDPVALAMQIWSAVHGAVSLELAGAAPVECAPEQTYAGVLELLVHGLAPRTSSGD